MGRFLECEQISGSILCDLKKKFDRLNRKIGIALFASLNPHFSSYEKQIYKNAKKFANLQITKYSYDLEKNDNVESLKSKILTDLDYVNKSDEIIAIFLESLILKFLKETANDFYDYLSYKKDLEAIHPINLGKILLGEREHLPPTVSAILKLIDAVKKDLKGDKVVIVNHSEIIGKPLALALLHSKANAPTVTVCHIGTKNLHEETRKADFLITAIGRPNFFNTDYIKENAVVIDVGFTKLGSQVCGDVDVKNIFDKVSYITPVPKGVGLITIAYFFYNVVCCMKKQGLIN